MLAFLIFLPTVYSIPQYFFILPFVYILIKNKFIVEIPENTKNNFYLIILIIILSSINFLFGIPKIENYSNVFPYTVLYLMTFYIALSTNKSVLKSLILLIAIETFVVYIEVFLGVNTIFTSSLDYKHFDSITYLYFFRPHGISSGSSTVAYKIMIMILLIDYLNLKSKKYQILYILGLIAIIIVFNRTVIVAVSLYLIVKNLKYILKVKYFILSSVLIILFLMNTNLINEQFNRGHDTVDLSYRDVIWAKNFSFISDNILFGNYSKKYSVLLDEYMEYAHAHNSFIEVLSTNGIIIFLLYLVLISVNINKENYIYIMVFIIYSMYQYGIFWGISFLDIIFLRILIIKREET